MGKTRRGDAHVELYRSIGWTPQRPASSHIGNAERFDYYQAQALEARLTLGGVFESETGRKKGMSLSQLARSIQESPTLKLNETAALLREKGEPVIHLGGGEPKSKTPMDAILSCTSVLNTGDVKYTPADGIPALKKAIIRYTEEHYGRLVAPENVIVSSGAKQSIMVLLHAILDPKDEVVFPSPYWVSYPEMVKLAGGVPVAAHPQDGTFQPTIRDIADVVGSYTKAIILNSPNNPSGVVYSKDFIAEIVEFCE